MKLISRLDVTIDIPFATSLKGRHANSYRNNSSALYIGPDFSGYLSDAERYIILHMHRVQDNSVRVINKETRRTAAATAIWASSHMGCHSSAALAPLLFQALPH